MTSMRRILSTKSLKLIGVFGRNPPSHACLTVGQSVCALNFSRKLTSDGTNMDLSNMRKKYKGDEEVRGVQRTVVTCVRGKYKEKYALIRCLVCVSAG